MVILGGDDDAVDEMFTAGATSATGGNLTKEDNINTTSTNN